MAIARGANVLELEICRIRLKVNDILLRLVQAGLAVGVGAAQSIDVGECRVVESIFIDCDTGGRPCCRGTEGGFQNECLLLGLWLQEFTMPTIPTLITDGIFFRGIQVQEIGASGTESHFVFLLGACV